MSRLRKRNRGPSHRIAVIDDDADLRASTVALLSNEGHEVSTAVDPESGVALIRAWQPHLVLLDYYMDGGTGADVVREVRTFDEHLQVLLVTGYAAEQPGRRLMSELDIQGYHNKSDGAERLLVLVDGALKHYRALNDLNIQRGYLQRILEAAPMVNRLQPMHELLHVALQQFAAVVDGGDGFIAASNNGLFVLGDAEARINIHAGTGKYDHVRGLRDLPTHLAPVVTSGMAAKVPFYDACGLLVVPLETRDGDRGCMLLECAQMPRGGSDPCMLFAKQVVQSLENVLLYEMATVDSLTRVSNRGHGLQRLSETLRLASRSSRSTSIMMLDIDHFKQVNDRHGHAAGDVVLRRIGAALANTCRESDVVSRYGGEEFVVVLPDTDEAGSLVAAERLRHVVAELEVKFEGLRIAVSTSVGVATTRGSGESPTSLLRRADEALYRAKAEGRNRVCSARETSAAPSPRDERGAA